MEETSDPVELRIYSGTDAEFILYEDEGDGYDYENGSFSLIPIYWNENDQTLTISTRIGTYPGMSASRTFQVKIIGSDIDASGDNDITILYNGETKILAF
jgi:alpha-D-xyloside xylohydrolase